MYANSELLNYITKKYDLYKNKKINIEILQKISKNEKIEIKDLLCLLEISSNTSYKLKNKMQKYTKLKFNNYLGINYKKMINRDKITKEEFIKLKNKLDIKDYTLMRLLGISEYKYNKMKNDEVNEVLIIDVKIKHIVDLIKLDFKYIKKYEKKEYYSKDELEEICKERNISLEQFIKYFNNNPKHYKFNKIVIENSPKGLWIGSTLKMPDEFITKNYYKIKNRLEYIIIKYNKIINWYSYKEDLIEDAIMDIFQRCGDIVKKFYFDAKLTINILVLKCKYIMFNNYRKKYINNIIYYESYDNSFLDHSNLFRDDRYDPQNIFM